MFPCERTPVKFTRVNEIEARYERPRVKVKVQRGSTFTSTRDLPHIVSILFTRARTEKSGDRGNPPQQTWGRRCAYFIRTLSMTQGSKLTLANSQNASDFGNLRVRKISTGKPLRVRIIHVSQAFGESCSNVWTRSEANKQRSLSWEEHVFVSHCQRYCTEALCQTFAFACCCCSSWFWSYHFHYTRYEIWSLTFQRERICSWSRQFARGKKSY